MRELFDEILALLAVQPVALARIVDRTGTGPRDTGAAMAVAADGRVVGSLSGGCVEAAVVTTASQVLRDGHASTERFAAADEFAVGLPCGGEIEVFVERLDATDAPLFGALVAALAAHEPVAYATTLESAPDRRLPRPGRARATAPRDRAAAASSARRTAPRPPPTGHAPSSRSSAPPRA